MDVSVIVPTYNGEKKIARLLNALQSQTEKNFELIVVIDGSTDSTIDVLKEYQKKMNNLKVTSQENKGRSSVRNRGVKESTGELLIFYDDDMEPSPNSVQMHVEFHQSNSRAVLGGNPMEYYSKTKTDIQNYKAWLCQKWMTIYDDGVNKLTKQNCFLTAANMSVSRSTFQILNGFDEKLSDSEDQDFAFRAMENNIPVYFDKSNICIHHELITCKGYIKRIRQYSIAHEKLNSLYPKRYGQLDKKQTPFINRIIYSLFAFNFWHRWIDQYNLFIWMPKPLRYKFYDMIVHALGREFRNVKLV